jgi:hypothetical protein
MEYGHEIWNLDYEASCKPELLKTVAKELVKRRPNFDERIIILK